MAQLRDNVSRVIHKSIVQQLLLRIREGVRKEAVSRAGPVLL